MHSTATKMALKAAFIVVSLAAPLAAQKAVIQPPTAARATETRTLKLNDGGKLRVGNINGYVKIYAWDKEEVALSAEFASGGDGKHASIESDNSADSLKLLVKFPKTDKKLFKSHKGANCNIELFVPSRVEGDIESVNGEVRVKGLAGNNKFGTVNGKIILEDVAGKIKVSTVNGSIDANVQNIENALNMSTVNGSIKLKVDGKLDAQLVANTVNGKVKIDSHAATNLETGRFKTKAKFGNGRADISLETVNGSITVE